MVFDEAFKYLTLETTVRILDGPDAAELNLRLFRVMQSVPDEAAPLSWFGQTLSPTEFLDAMIAEDRLIYEFEVNRAHGLIGGGQQE